MAVRFLPAYPTLLLFLLTVLTLGCRAAAQCAFSEDDCIDPLAQTAVSLSFQPLFTQNITFYYGFDAQGPDDPEQQALPENERMPIVKASFWLRYAHTYLDSDDVRENRTSEIALRVGNLTGSPSGGNNGCDGVWGPPCSEQIRQWLKRSMFELSITGSYFVDPLDTILGQTKVPPPELLSCPPTLFDVQYIPVESKFLKSNPGSVPWSISSCAPLNTHESSSVRPRERIRRLHRVGGFREQRLAVEGMVYRPRERCGAGGAGRSGHYLEGTDIRQCSTEE